MTLDEALGEAVSGHNVTCASLGAGYVEYTISGGWRVHLSDEPDHASFKMRADDPRFQDEWYYWQPPVCGDWGQTTAYIYTPADAVLKDYAGPPVLPVTVALGFDASTMRVTVDGEPHGDPIPAIMDWAVDAALSERPAAPWGNETVRYRDYDVFRDDTGAMCGFLWAYTHKDYDGPEDNRGGHCRTFAECLDEIDEAYDD